MIYWIPPKITFPYIFINALACLQVTHLRVSFHPTEAFLSLSSLRCSQLWYDDEGQEVCQEAVAASVSFPLSVADSQPRDVAALVDRILQASDQELVPVLGEFQIWRYPRGDLHAWIPILDRFDAILGETVESYELSKLQANDFTPKTKEILLEILRVQKLLLENCTNRKLFASYDVSWP